ncbi:hypothetical protein SAMN05518672_1011025 [Chitinophaga sp. CF118]|uniref:hypothetical protein n=1 Tax=Chitinophaga sp. CF118 TaxID=1884367 RepID=UPI0008EDC44B|nr:hypothetical protein [Chitinophaga sp. CF118]SFD20352.1 hypothetical protein SAMN05518672_1011025 [Chitinophaga sp. CF118]
MTMKTPLLPHEFKQYIWHDRENRISLLLSVIAALILFFIFKRLYPFPNFLPDSYSYIDAAFNNVNINMWPVGYSKFLRFISVFNRSDTGMALIQYLLLQASILFFLFTIRYLLHPGKWVMRILFAFLVLNPLWFYISNFVSSDALFAALSLLWFTSLFWILYLPNLRMLILHALVLGYVFSVRYNALYYPIISILVILLAKGTGKAKLYSLLIILVPVSWFVIYTSWTYKEKTGVFQFSAFGGWQLGSNALFMYAHVPTAATSPVPAKFKKIHQITTKHMDSLRHVKQRPDNELGIYYLWDEKAPLKIYMAQKYARDSTTPYLKRWSSVAPLYAQYGAWLIKQHPSAYVQYYLLPNLVNYYSPSPEFLAIDNMGKDSVDQGAVMWFGYKKNKVTSLSKDRKIILTAFFPPILAMINIIFFLGFLGFMFLGGFRNVDTYYKKALLIMLLVWVSNLAFSVLASPIVLRYQAFPFIITLAFGGLMLGYVVKESFTPQEHYTKPIPGEAGIG